MHPIEVKNEFDQYADKVKIELDEWFTERMNALKNYTEEMFNSELIHVFEIPTLD